jgi:hypothetical protein
MLMIAALGGCLFSGSITVHAETSVALDCIDDVSLPVQAEYIVERNAVFVHLRGNADQSLDRVETLKACLAVAGRDYQGDEPLWGGVTVNGFDDTELAETLYITFDPQTRQVMQQAVQLPADANR